MGVGYADNLPHLGWLVEKVQEFSVAVTLTLAILLMSLLDRVGLRPTA